MGKESTWSISWTRNTIYRITATASYYNIILPTFTSHTLIDTIPSMFEIARTRSPENLNPPLDCLILLAHNKSPFLPNKEITKPPYLSFMSKMNAYATICLFRAGYFNKLIISSGQTSGSQYPSEAYAIYEYMLNRFPEEVSKIDVIIEDESTDTTSNIREISKIVSKYDFKKLGLISHKDHALNATTLADNNGLNIHTIFPSEEITKLLLNNNDKTMFAQLFEEYRYLVGDKQLEIVRGLLVKHIDPKGIIPNIITTISRKILQR